MESRPWYGVQHLYAKFCNVLKNRNLPSNHTTEREKFLNPKIKQETLVYLWLRICRGKRTLSKCAPRLTNCEASWSVFAATYVLLRQDSSSIVPLIDRLEYASKTQSYNRKHPETSNQIYLKLSSLRYQVNCKTSNFKATTCRTQPWY